MKFSFTLVATLLALILLVGAQNYPTIFELSDGEQKGIGAGFDVVQDARQPPWLFEYTYNRGSKMTVNGKTYAVPDFLAGSSVHKVIFRNESLITNNWSDYFSYTQKDTTINAAVTVKGVSLNLAFSNQKGYINHLTKNGTNSFGWNSAVFISHQLQFKGLNRPPLDVDFAYDVKSLPKTYNANLYDRFVRAWGTHYFTRALYGCMFNVTISFDKKFIEKKSTSWTQSQLDLTLKYKEFEFGYKTNKVVNKTDIDGNFLDGAKVEVNARGGDEYLFTDHRDYSAWADSCRNSKAPLVFYSDVEPIHELIDDPAKKANVLKAIQTYGTKGHA